MPSSTDSGDCRPPRPQLGGTTTPHPPQPEPEQLPCPRCSSTNTKFCYYNNYNLSQPRHFCKSCRRYWTRGGTLRNVPVGGATRSHKNTAHKRPRTTPSSATTTTASTDASFSPSANPSYDPVPADPMTRMPTVCGSGVNLNEKVPEEAEGYAASFLDLNGGGYFGLGGYGAGFREMGFGVGSGMWQNQMEDVGGENGVVGGNGWQGGGVEGGMGDGSCYGWPDLAISTTGEGLK